MQETIGSKALNLERLRNMGCRVPDFIVLSAEVLQEMDVDEMVFRTRVEKIIMQLPAHRYAVRSAAVQEDTAEDSQAGQFLTRTDVSKTDLAQAIREVMEHAKRKSGSLQQFSLLVQVYIEADVSGVTFTRSPMGERELVIEYHRGRGEELVSGRVKPFSTRVFWTEPTPSHELPLAEGITQFRAIEQLYKHPQDIEWCIADGHWYFLQTRPITTISPERYRAILLEDQLLPSGNTFLYEQTELCETTPRPKPFLLSLIRRLYAKDGPIQRVYARYGISYEPKQLFHVVGNQLYVDREEERATLFPPTRTLASWWRKERNTWRVGAIRVRDITKQIIALSKALEEIPVEEDMEHVWSAFASAYEHIFDINLLASASLKRLDRVLKPYGISSVRILSSSFQDGFFSVPAMVYSLAWRGNGLDITEDPFIVSSRSSHEDTALSNWWSVLPTWKKAALTPFIEQAIACNALRERGRWLAVGYMNAFRRALGTRSLFGTLDEYLYEKGCSEELLREREQEFHRFDHVTLASRLTNREHIQNNTSQKGISSGQAEGVLVTREALRTENVVQDIILYTESLTPDLAPELPRLRGILSAKGGALSHLAILAREHRIPVVTGVVLGKHGRIIGARVTMDGDTGDVDVRS